MYNFTDAAQYAINAHQPFMPGPGTMTPQTPDNKLSEGIDSTQTHRPAPWLPLVRYNDEFRTHVVISSQKPVAFAIHPDGTEWLVPAGYALLLEGNDQTLKYTKEDVKNGVKNAQGNLVTDGEAVMTSVRAANIKISPFFGIANYNILRHAGGDGINPNQLNYRNYNPQPNVSVNFDYAYEFPMVKDQATLDGAPLTGISAFVGKKAMAGQFITYDKHSNYVLASEDDFEYGSVKPQRIIGQVSKVTKFKDPDTGALTKASFNQLDRVVNPGVGGFVTGELNSLPGVNNGGFPAKMSYANAYGLISFALQTR